VDRRRFPRDRHYVDTVIDPATGHNVCRSKTKESVALRCSAGSLVTFIACTPSTSSPAQKSSGTRCHSAPKLCFPASFHRRRCSCQQHAHIGFGSHGDISPWFGWLLGYDRQRFARRFVFSTSNPEREHGASFGAVGRVPRPMRAACYVATGKAAYDGTKNFPNPSKNQSDRFLDRLFTPLIVPLSMPTTLTGFCRCHRSSGYRCLHSTSALTCDRQIAILYLLDISHQAPVKRR